MKKKIDNLINYKIIPAKKEHLNLLIRYKLDTILEYANDLEKTEMINIKNYVNENVPRLLENYKLILISNILVGAVLFYEKDDGILLDEIYIEKKHRNIGIGTNIIKDILRDNNIVYLWVYKLNVNAIKLYKKMNFKVIEETETRYFMKYTKES